MATTCCRGCGLSNLPYLQDCSFCGAAVQTPLEAHRKKQEWEALSEPLRDEFSREYARTLERYREWVATLKRDRWKHAAYGAAAFALPMTFILGKISAIGFWFGVAFLADLGLGAALGYAINRLRGGEYRGMLAFGAAYAASAVTQVAVGLVANPFDMGGFGAAGPALFLFCTFIIMLVVGYLFGMNLSLERSLR